MSDLSVSIVKSMNEWIQCQQIRSAAFLTTEPYHEEFDGNDFELVTHLLAVDKNTPAACMRLKYVGAETMHWGRLALMPNLLPKNRLSILNKIANYADEYCSELDIKKVLGEVADNRLLKFWQRRGFVLTGEDSIQFGNKQYLPVVKYLTSTYCKKDETG